MFNFKNYTMEELTQLEEAIRAEKIARSNEEVKQAKEKAIEALKTLSSTLVKYYKDPYLDFSGYTDDYDDDIRISLEDLIGEINYQIE